MEFFLCISIIIWLEVGAFNTFFYIILVNRKSVFPQKKLNFGEPQKFIPAKCKNF